MEIISIIEYLGDNKTIVWKHPKVNFNNNSQLIVRESQEAIFFLNGEALDSFGPGKHSLETGKIPLLSEKLKKVTGGDVYQSEVYFVNLIEQMSINWGTNPRIRFIDKTAGGYQFDIGLFGKLSLKINNPRKLVQNFVGTESTLGQEKLISYIKPAMMQKIRSILAKTLCQQEISVFELDMHTDEIAENLRMGFRDEISNLGFEVTGFWIEGFDFPETDPTYIKIRELRGQRVTAMQEQKMQQELALNALQFDKTYEMGRANLDAEKELVKARADGEKTVIGAQAMATKRAAEGYSYAEETTRSVAEKLAENSNVGNMLSTGVGLGMMGGMAMGVGGTLSNTIAEALSPLNRSSSHEESTQQNGVNELISMVNEDAEADDFEKKIRKVKLMRDTGLISDEEYEIKKQSILDSI